VTLLSPAGLWRDGIPWYCMVSLRLSRWLARHAGPALSTIVATRPGRAIVLGQVLAHPARLTAGQARSVVQAIGTCPGFDATLKATARRRIHGAQQVTAPVTVAFGSRDLVLLRHQSRQAHERMTEIKMRLLGDRVSRRTAWQLARQHDWDTLRDAEYLAVTRLQADALVTVDPSLAAKARDVVTVASIDDLLASR
jgi:predicted nucleic acid-binding protein